MQTEIMRGVALAFSVAASIVQAADVVRWNGGEGVWTGASNWSSGSPPAAADVVNFDEGGTVNLGSIMREAAGANWINSTNLEFTAASTGGLSIISTGQGNSRVILKGGLLEVASIRAENSNADAVVVFDGGGPLSRNVLDFFL